MATPKRTRRTDGSVPCNCLICNKRFVNRKALVDHIERIHAAQIPEGWPAARYENYLRTGKTEGKCVICGKPTPWNSVTEKYGRMCGSDACRKTARDRAKNNYIDKHGKEYTLNDPEQQRKMVYARKNAGKYIFEDETTGKKYEALYDSGYGKEFFEMLDTLLFWPGSDIMAPSPHTYYYEYEGETHFYIPDAYIYTLNAEIELKDGGKNPNTHPKILAVDKVKERLKDEVMESLKDQVNYIKICDKNYAEFFAKLAELRAQDTSLPKWESKLAHVAEAYLPSDSNYGEMFNSYYLDDRKYDQPGGWDEEHFSKTLDGEINNVLSNFTKEDKGDKIFYVYTMGANFFKTYRAVLLGAIHVYWYSRWEPGHPPKYDYEWDYQEEVRAEDCYDLREDTVCEGSNLVIPKMNLIRRNELLINPVLNYDALLEDYRKRLFHKKLSKKNWDALYNELLRVRNNLKVVINGNSENDKRLNYEAKKALTEVERFIAYMEDRGTVKESVDIFTSGDFDEYRDYADLDAARADILEGHTSTQQFYYISEKNFGGSIVQPRVPDNWMTRNGYEDDKTKRVCLCPSIHQCLMAMSEPLVGKQFYVHVPVGNYKIIPTQDKTPLDHYVPDSDLTGEVWIEKPVRMGLIGLIEVISPLDDPISHTYTYGDGKSAELYNWSYRWVFGGGGDAINAAETSFVMEGVVSHINPNYTGKETLRLTDYRRVPIGKDVLKKYKGKYPMLRHIREDDGGIIWFDGDNVVAVVGAAPHRDTTDPSEIWVHSFEISKEYRNHGLARQILDIAIKELNAQYLSVAKKNEVALELYKKVGFVTYGENKDMWFMKLRDAKTPKFADRSVTEACKDIATARKFVSEVGKLAKKYDANYFLVTDGASGTSNQGNPAVSHARQSHEEWEKHHGFDPDEDWSKVWRVTYDGVGIYEAYRNSISDAEWHKFKNSSAAKWLPIPPKYGENYRSYFTYEGLQKFNKLVLPMIAKVLNPKKILIEEVPMSESPSVTYRDEYQLVMLAENAMIRSTELMDIVAFNKATNNMEYILPNGGNIITRISEEDYYKYYRLLSPEDFEKYNGGVCWDYVLYEAKYFDKYFPDVKYKTFYFCSEKGNSHTFLIFELDNVYYWYESSWKTQVGLYGFRSEKDAVDYVTNLLLTDLITRENNGVPMRGYVFEYDVDEVAIGTRCWNYMKHMIRKLDQLGDRKCLVKKRQVRPIRVMKGKVIYESAVGLSPAFQREPLMEAFKDNDNDVSFGKSENDVLSIIKTMTPTEQIYLGTPGGRRYNWSRSEFYQEVLYVGQTPVAFLVVSEIPSNKGVGHIIIGVRAGNQYRHKGYASMLINRFITSDKIPPHITSLEWGFDDGNIKSEHLAAKFGFSNPTVPEDQVHHRGYIMTQSVDGMKNVIKESVIDDRYHLVDMPGIQLQTTLPYTNSVGELIHKSTMREENWYNTLESTYMEATRDGLPYFPVFIFLSYTGTKMAQIIKSFTRDPYAHSSISFDTTLENMISFNRDGMVVENIKDGMLKKNAKEIKYSLYMYMATAQEYDTMKQFVDELLMRKGKLKYNLLGLTNFVFGRGSEREDKFFCSEFVASVISAGNNTLLKQSPHMTTPYNLAKNKNFIFIKKGILSHYDQTVVDKIIAEKLEEGGFDNVIIK